jgi:hypothetical protein
MIAADRFVVSRWGVRLAGGLAVFLGGCSGSGSVTRSMPRRCNHE